MSKPLYVAWALAVLLALALPVALPYAIWPRSEGAQADPVAECGRRAKHDVIAADYSYAAFLPLSVTVEQCARPPGEVPRYRARVTARGPYGIPVASYLVSTQGITAEEAGGNWAMAASALLAGAFLASMPFGLVWMRRRLSRRLQFAT